MSGDRKGLVPLAIGAVALVLALLLGGWRGAAPSYLAAWLCLLALPAGALPLVVVLERIELGRGLAESHLLGRLRGLLALMPLAALLALPLLFALKPLYPWARGEVPATALAGVWFTTPFLVARVIAYFAAWLWLALNFSRPAGDEVRGGFGRAVLGIGLHAVVGTLAVGDLAMATAAHFHSTLSGLLAMVAWSGLALAAATVLAPREDGPTRLDRLTPLAVLTAIWAFLHFVQFLVFWSANLPDAAAWYLARGGIIGRGLAILALAVAVLAALLTLRPGDGRTRVLAAFLVVVHVLEMAWLVTPSARGSFTLALTDALALVGVAGLAVGLAPRARRVLAARGQREAAA